MFRRWTLAAAAAALLPAFTCSKRAAIDMADVEIPPPTAKQLEIWQREFDEGATWRGDPKRFAHEEIQRRLDVPWKGEVFDPTRYEFTEKNPEKPQWGSYVVRRYQDVSGRLISYQVQMSRHGSVWYSRKVRHYFSVEMMHPALEDKDYRRH
jgi:hypothetical protein